LESLESLKTVAGSASSTAELQTFCQLFQSNFEEKVKEMIKDVDKFMTQDSPMAIVEKIRIFK
jgi:hypothetical protein